MITGLLSGLTCEPLGHWWLINIAIVPWARRFKSVRVLDSLEDEGMEKKEMMDAIAEAMDMGMKKYRPGMDAAAFDMEGMKKSFMDSISSRP